MDNDKIVSIIKECWSRKLFVPASDIADNANFFSLGGDSITLLTIMSELGAVLEMEFAISDYQHFLTIEKLRSYISLKKPG